MGSSAPPRRIESEPKSNRCREGERKRGRHNRDGKQEFPERRSRRGARNTEQHTDRTADRRKHRRLDQELQQNCRISRPDRYAQTNLARALRDGDKHDVHDADAPNHEGCDRKKGRRTLHASFPSSSHN